MMDNIIPFKDIDKESKESLDNEEEIISGLKQIINSKDLDIGILVMAVSNGDIKTFVISKPEKQPTIMDIGWLLSVATYQVHKIDDISRQQSND